MQVGEAYRKSRMQMFGPEAWGNGRLIAVFDAGTSESLRRQKLNSDERGEKECGS